MIVQAATAGSLVHPVRGVDTILQFGPTRAKAIVDAGFAFIIRYLGSLTALERNVILSAGAALLACTYCRRPGWIPSGELGDQDGVHAVANARMAGLPEPMSLFLDDEGASPWVEATAQIEYINAWASRVIAAGYKAGLYVGYGLQLTSEQLYKSLKVTGYWHSCSKVQEVSHRGYQMVQEQPPNQHVAGVLVDVNHIVADNEGDTPNWLIGAA